MNENYLQSRKMLFVGLLWWAMGMLTACCGDVIVHSSVVLLFLITLFCVLGLSSMLSAMENFSKYKRELVKSN